MVSKEDLFGAFVLVLVGERRRATLVDQRFVRVPLLTKSKLVLMLELTLKGRPSLRLGKPVEERRSLELYQRGVCGWQATESR